MKEKDVQKRKKNEERPGAPKRVPGQGQQQNPDEPNPRPVDIDEDEEEEQTDERRRA